MTKEFEPEHFRTVAEELLFPDEDDPDSEWNEIADARHRTAVGRSYYAVFLVFTGRLESLGLVVPRTTEHWMLRNATKAVLGEKHPLSAALKRLRHWRTQADYVPKGKIAEQRARERLEDCDDALQAVDSLTAKELSDIAREIRSDVAVQTAKRGA